MKFIQEVSVWETRSMNTHLGFQSVGISQSYRNFSWLNQDAAKFTFKYILVKWSFLSAFTFCSQCSAECVSLAASVGKSISVLHFAFHSIFNNVTFLKDVTKHGNQSQMTDQSETLWKITALDWQRSRHNFPWDCRSEDKNQHWLVHLEEWLNLMKKSLKSTTTTKTHRTTENFLKLLYFLF